MAKADCDCLRSNPTWWMAFAFFTVLLLLELSILNSLKSTVLEILTPITLSFLIVVVTVAALVSAVAMGVFLFMNLDYYHEKSKVVKRGS